MPRRIKTTQAGPAPAKPRQPARTPAEDVDLVVARWEAEGGFKDQTVARATELLARYAARLEATGRASLADATAADAEAFVRSATRAGTPPEVATMHARRGALRMAYRTLRDAGVATGDPTLDLVLPPRPGRVARPLTDAEVVLCRMAALTVQGGAAALRSAAWALGEAGAVASEITCVRIRDLDDLMNPVRVSLPGTARHERRLAPLTE